MCDMNMYKTRGKITACLNNSAVSVTDYFPPKLSKWCNDPNPLTEHDFAHFLGINFQEMDDLTHIVPGQKFKSPESRANSSEQTSPMRSNAKTPNIPHWIKKNTELQTKPRAKPVTPRTKFSTHVNERAMLGNFAWDNTNDTAMQMKRSSSIVIPVEHKRQQVFSPSQRFDWWIEVSVHAKLGMWAPEHLPRSFREADSLSDIEHISQQSVIGTIRGCASHQPSTQANPTKRFLQRFGGTLLEFFHHVQENQVDSNDLSMAIHLCHFGLALGVKRSLKNFEETRLRQLRNRRISFTRSAAMPALGRSPSFCFRRPSKINSLAELKSLLNRLILGELNQICTYDVYQARDTTALGYELTTAGTMSGLVMTVESGDSSMHSDVASLTDVEELVESVRSMGKLEQAISLDMDTQTTKSSQSNHPTAMEAIAVPNTEGVSEDVKNITLKEGSSVDTMFNSLGENVLSAPITSITDVRAVKCSSPPSRTSLGDKKSLQFIVNSVHTNGEAEEQATLSKKTLQRFDVQSIAGRTHRQSEIRPKRKQSRLRRSTFIHNKTTLIPDLKFKVPAFDVICHMVNQYGGKTGQSQSRGERQNSVNSTVFNVARYTTRTQPVVTRVICERFSELDPGASRASKIQTSMMDDLITSASLASNRFLLPTIKPFRSLGDNGMVESRRLSRLSHPTRLISASSANASEMSSSLSSASAHTGDTQKIQISKISPGESSRTTTGGGGSAVTVAGTAGGSVMTKWSVSRQSMHSLTANRKFGSNMFSRSSPMFVTGAEHRERRRLREEMHRFLIPRLSEKPHDMLQAIAYELHPTSPFLMQSFQQILSTVIPEEKWLTEKNPVKLMSALERLGADLLLYRHSSGHMIRFKLMSILAASGLNRFLRRQLKYAAVLQGNWLDQLLRTLTSEQSTCRTEAALVLCKLAMETRLMNQLLIDRRSNIADDIFQSIFRAIEYCPTMRSEYYLTLGYFLQYNQCQVICDSLIERGTHCHSIQVRSCGIRLLAHVYTHWRQKILESLTINEKRLSKLLDSAYMNPSTKQSAKAVLAAISVYHVINSNLITIWRLDVSQHVDENWTINSSQVQ